MKYCIYNETKGEVLADGFDSVMEAGDALRSIISHKKDYCQRNGIEFVEDFLFTMPYVSTKVADYIVEKPKPKKTNCIDCGYFVSTQYNHWNCNREGKEIDYLVRRCEGFVNRDEKPEPEPEPPKGFRLVRIQYCKDCRHRDFGFDEDSSESCFYTGYHAVEGENHCSGYEFAGKREEPKPEHNCRECVHCVPQLDGSIYCKKHGGDVFKFESIITSGNCRYFEGKEEPKPSGNNCRECEHGQVNSDGSICCDSSGFKLVITKEEAITDSACDDFKKKKPAPEHNCRECEHFIVTSNGKSWCNEESDKLVEIKPGFIKGGHCSLFSKKEEITSVVLGSLKKRMKNEKV